MSYRHTEEMGEISGFGGGYEELCQDMLEAGVKLLVENPDMDPHFKGYEGIYGIIDADNEDGRKLSEVIINASNDECTGAMHQAAIMRLLYISKHGWDRYCKEVIEQRKGQKQAVDSKEEG